jgi:DNA-binding transcriptional LysR family regulator
MRYFIAVAEEQHLGRAAARLRISTPTLSQQIKAVERQVGAPLLVRHGHGVNLTEAGQVLLREARKTLRAAEDALRETRRVAGVAGESLRLGLLTGVPPWLPEQIARLRPGCALEMVPGETREQLRRLERGEVELALVRAPVTLPPGTQLTELAVEELGVLMSAGNPLATCADVDMADLAGRELVWFGRNMSSGLHDSVIGQLRSHGGDVVVTEDGDHWAAVLAAQPDAIGLGPSHAARPPDLVWRPLHGRPLTVTYAAAWRTDSRNSALRGLVRALSRRAFTPPGEAAADGGAAAGGVGAAGRVATAGGAGAAQSVTAGEGVAAGGDGAAPDA